MFFTLRINYLLAKIMKHGMSMFVDGFGIQKKKNFCLPYITTKYPVYI